MKKPFVFAVFVIFTCTSLVAQADSTKNWATDFVGTWQIDLRPSPEAEPYLKNFIVSELKGKTFSGEFYETPFTEGKIHTNWGKLFFSFMTTDGKNSYFHSGTIENGKVQGQSYSPERAFVMPWFGMRK
jgi:hypothetical protein